MLKLTLLVWFIFSLSDSALACMHATSSYTSKLIEKTKEGLIYHDGTNSHLIIGTSVTAEKGRKLPNQLAWIIPLPSLPSSYKEETSGLFQALRFKTSPNEMYYRGYTGGRGVPESLGKGSIEVHDTEIVGGYEITPIQIKKKDSGIALNQWLKRNRFKTVNSSEYQYYAKTGSVFLAIKVKDIKSQTIELTPLHITYKSKNVSFPLKFSSHSGIFNIDLWVFCMQKEKPTKLMKYLPDYYFEGKVHKINRSDASTPTGLYFAVPGDGYLAHISGVDINSKGRKVSKMRNDPVLICD